MEKDDFAEALSHIKQLLQKEPGNIQLIEQIAAIYQKWIDAEPENAISLIPKIENDFKWWQEQGDKSVEKDINSKALNYKRLIMVKAAVIKLEIEQNEDSFQQVNQALDKILELDNDNLQAVYYKMMNCYQLGTIKHKDKSDSAESFFQEAKELSERLSNHSEYKTKAEQVKSQIEQIQKKKA